jgi:hypothetical protein
MPDQEHDLAHGRRAGGVRSARDEPGNDPVTYELDESLPLKLGSLFAAVFHGGARPPQGLGYAAQGVRPTWLF